MEIARSQHMMGRAVRVKEFLSGAEGVQPVKIFISGTAQLFWGLVSLAGFVCRRKGCSGIVCVG